MGASPDGLLECKCCGLGLVEVKCPLCIQQSSLGEAVDAVSNFCLEQKSDGKYQLKRDHRYYYQCQLQIFVTKRSFCDFVVWTTDELHVERLTLDDTLITSALPSAESFFKLCILPELLGKWYTHKELQTRKNQSLQSEEDNGSWCYTKEGRGGDMIACENKSCSTVWYHLQCVGLSAVPQGKWFCSTCPATVQKRKRKL